MANAHQMKLGFSIGSIGYHYAAWRLPEASPDGGLSARHYIEGAQLAERGKFDFVFIADVAAIRNFDDVASLASENTPSSNWNRPWPSPRSLPAPNGSV